MNNASRRMVAIDTLRPAPPRCVLIRSIAAKAFILRENLSWADWPALGQVSDSRRRGGTVPSLFCVIVAYSEASDAVAAVGRPGV